MKEFYPESILLLWKISIVSVLIKIFLGFVGCPLGLQRPKPESRELWSLIIISLWPPFHDLVIIPLSTSPLWSWVAKSGGP